MITQIQIFGLILFLGTSQPVVASQCVSLRDKILSDLGIPFSSGPFLQGHFKTVLEKSTIEPMVNRQETLFQKREDFRELSENLFVRDYFEKNIVKFKKETHNALANFFGNYSFDVLQKKYKDSLSKADADPEMSEESYIVGSGILKKADKIVRYQIRGKGENQKTKLIYLAYKSNLILGINVGYKKNKTIYHQIEFIFVNDGKCSIENMHIAGSAIGLINAYLPLNYKTCKTVLSFEKDNHTSINEELMWKRATILGSENIRKEHSLKKYIIKGDVQVVMDQWKSEVALCSKYITFLKPDESKYKTNQRIETTR